MDSPKLIYLAGPFRGETKWQTEKNIRRAEEWSMYLWERGIANVCPHANGRWTDGHIPDSVAMAGAMEMMRRCDGLAVIPGWRKSEGTMAEIKEARAILFERFYLPDDTQRLIDWYTRR